MRKKAPAAVFLLIAASILVYWLLVRPRAPREPLDPNNLAQTGPQNPDSAPRASNTKDNALNSKQFLQEGPAPAGDGTAQAESKEIQAKRAQRARHVLDNYKAWAKYPPSSRPMAEHPDQIHPHYVASSHQPISRPGQKLSDAKVRLSQDRLYLVGDEQAELRMACETSEGPAPCAISSSKAVVPSHYAHPQGISPQSDVNFSAGDPGSPAIAVFQPSAQGFSAYSGPIQIQITLSVEGERGWASFELMYTPEAPAVFLGQYRESLEEGSLHIYTGIEVRRAGRYIIAARVDDAEGKSFAYLQFNDEIAEGKQELKLTVFGKLIRDMGARSPFRLRDIEGYLLKENTYPDRDLIAGIDGLAYTTKSYALRDFSDDEWQSEEKERHLKEFQKDLGLSAAEE